MSAPQHTIFEAAAPRRTRVAGIGLTATAGDPAAGGTVTWAVTLPVGVAPRPGDAVRDAAGRRWTITAVGERSGDTYSCVCAKAV